MSITTVKGSEEKNEKLLFRHGVKNVNKENRFHGMDGCGPFRKGRAKSKKAGLILTSPIEGTCLMWHSHPFWKKGDKGGGMGGGGGGGGSLDHPEGWI
jgi:hypothetical protein